MENVLDLLIYFPQKSEMEAENERTRSFRVEIITFRFHVGFSNA